MLDALCHLHREPLFSRREQVAARAMAAGVERLLTPSTDPASWDRVALCRPHGPVAFGVHPWFAEQGTRGLAERLDCADAVGEIGLDRLRGPLEVQLPVFRAQLELAADAGLPVIVHCVRAWNELLPELRRVRSRALLHAYSGGPHLAEELLSLGCHFSFGRALLNPRARRLHEAVERLPSERILLESDSPDQLGGPWELPTVAEALAGLGKIPDSRLFGQPSRSEGSTGS